MDNPDREEALKMAQEDAREMLKIADAPAGGTLYRALVERFTIARLEARALEAERAAYVAPDIPPFRLRPSFAERAARLREQKNER